MAEYKSSSIDKVQYQGLEIQKIYVGSELFWPIAEGSGGSDPGENPDNPPVEPEKKITGLQITSFTVDELPWNGGTVVKHLEYLVSYSDGTTATSDENVYIGYTGDETIGVNPTIQRSDVGGISVRISYLDGDGNYYSDAATTRIYIAAVPAESITLTSYDVDDIPVEGGTVNSLNSFSIQVVYLNNKTYNYSSNSYITYKNSVTAGNSTNTSEHLVGYLRFTFTCPYIDNSLEFSVLVYQEAYVPVTETRLAYMQLKTSSSSTSLYTLRTETGLYFTFADLFSNDGVFNICAGIQSSGTQYVLRGNGSTSDQLAIAITSSGWWVYDDIFTNSYYSTVGTPNRNFFKILFTLNDNGTFLLLEFTNETFPSLGWNNINTSLTLSSPVFFNQIAQVYYIQIGYSTSTHVLLPYVNSNNERYFKDVITGKKYFVSETSSLSTISYDRMSIEPDIDSIQINKIPYSGGSYEETLDYWHTFVNVEIDSLVRARYFHTSAYNTITFSKTGTCPENSGTEEVNVGLLVATFKLFDFYDDPKTCTYSYNMTLEATPRKDYYMTDYNLCFAFAQKQYESQTISQANSTVHPNKTSQFNIIELDTTKTFLNGGIAMAVVPETYTSTNLAKDRIWYYNNATNCSIYKIGKEVFFETLTYFTYVTADGVRYNNSGFHNTGSNKYQFEFIFNEYGTLSDMLSNCPYTNVFIFAKYSSDILTSGTIVCKILPGYEYTYMGLTITHYSISVSSSSITISARTADGWEPTNLKTYSISNYLDYAILLDVPVKPVQASVLPDQLWYPRQGTIWIGTPE